MALRFAAIQMVSGFDLQSNLQEAERLIAEASANKVAALVLPENFAMFGASQFHQLAIAEKEKQVLSKFLSEQALKYKLWIFSGSIPTCVDTCIDDSNPNQNKVFASCLIFNPDGEMQAQYNKIHLFDVDVEDKHGQYRESDSICPGDEVCVVEMSGVRVGVAICYDLRFPELFRRMLDMGCDLIVLPSAFTKVTGAKHWEILVRARAIENQCFVVAANQGGLHVSPSGNERETFGNSMIVDAEGEVLKRLEEGSGLVFADLDFEKQVNTRKKMPVLQHRTLDI